MWKVLLAKKKYEEAKLFCKDDSFKLNKIRVRQAQDLFKQVRWSSKKFKSAHLRGCTEEELRLLCIAFWKLLPDLLRQKKLTQNKICEESEGI